MRWLVLVWGFFHACLKEDIIRLLYLDLPMSGDVFPAMPPHYSAVREVQLLESFAQACNPI